MQVILIAVVTKHSKDTSPDLKELETLALSQGLIAKEIVIQRLDSINKKYYFNEGKLTELKELIKEKEFEAIVCDDELSGMQLKNLQEVLDCL